MARITRCSLVVLTVVLLFPLAGLAQEGGASIAGVVKDASGAVLPGVSVEASSPVLIEKVRVATSDERGRYEIVGLRPGTYTVTFTLAGFAQVRRENINLMGEFTANIDAELKVGAVEETITVSGEAPVVDVVNAKREQVMTADVIESLPSSRIHSSLAQLVPGVQAASQDVGGTVVAAGLLSGHGTHGPDSRIMVNGLSAGSVRNSGGGVTTPNVGAMQESTVDYSGVGADSETGGIQVNMIPREGGNTLKGSSYASYASNSWQANNLTSDLSNRGLLVRDRIRDNYDINPGVGGPIVRDKLWFYLSGRNLTTNNYVGGLFINKNAGNPNAFTYVPDPSQQAVNFHNWKDTQVRFTWQASQRNKLAVTVEEMRECQCPMDGASATTAVEAAASSIAGQKHQYYVDYQLPLTSRVLFQADVFYREDDWHTNNTDGTQNALISPINIQSTSFNYRAQQVFNDSHHIGFYYRANLSYVTGTHNIKVGFLNEPAWLTAGMNAYNPVDLRITAPIEQGGVGNQLTLRATPFYPTIDVKRNLGLYAQDKWSVRRLTLGFGARFDNFVGGWRDECFGPTALVPNRNICFASGTANDWKDITPRTAATWDVFGDGKTALKATMNKYVGAASAVGTGLDATLNPFTALVSSTTRTWTDSNKNLVPDCDLTNPQAQNLSAVGGDVCGKDTDTNFGTNNIGGVTVDPNLRSGWGKRDYSWEFSTGVQRQLSQGVSLDVTYFRRWYGNFTVLQNKTTSAADFTQFSIVAPTATPFASVAPAGATLPGGGGYTIGGLYDLNQDKFGLPAQNYLTFASNFGNQIEHWNGLDVIANARTPFGLRLTGGTSTGKTVLDNCAVRAALPSIAPTNPWCHVDTGFLTDFTGLASYTIPKIDLLTSLTWQNRPNRAAATSIAGGGGAASTFNYGLQANYVVPCGAGTDVANQLGRSCTAAGGNVTVPLINQYSILGPRFTQIDLRFGKVVRIASTRTVLNFDIYNALNTNAVLTSNTSFAVWQQPNSLLLARFVKVGVQFDF